MSELPMADLKEARAAYFDIITRFGLGPLDVHAIMLGAAIDVLMLHVDTHYAGSLKALERDSETVRKLFARRGQEKQLTAFAILGWAILLSTGTVDVTKSNVPERCAGCDGRGRIGEGATGQVCPVCNGRRWSQ